jgi:flagellar FliL protein
VDSFQVYLRELRVEDLKGSAGMYRLREDLLRRINEAARPVKISDVLFKEMLIQ